MKCIAAYNDDNDDFHSISVSHPRYISGIIKFKGQLDHGQFDSKLYVGIRLDEEGKYNIFEHMIICGSIAILLHYRAVINRWISGICTCLYTNVYPADIVTLLDY